jgi:hypothetical protein
MQAIERRQERREEYLPTMGAFLQRLTQLPEAAQSCKMRGDWTPSYIRSLATRAAVIVLILVAVWVGGSYAMNGDLLYSTNPSQTSEGAEEADSQDELTSTPRMTATPEQTATPTPVNPTATRVSRDSEDSEDSD